MAVHALHSKKQGSLPAEVHFALLSWLFVLCVLLRFIHRARPSDPQHCPSQPQALHITSQHWAQCLAIKTQATQTLSRWLLA